MDLNAIRSKLNSLQQTNKGNGGNDRSLFWKPSVGKQVIRIVPNKFNKSNPFTEVYFHYGIGERTMISPINFGEKDPIVEFAKQLRTTSDKENWRLAKKLDPKMRIFAPVVVRGEEHEGVKWWGFGKTVYQELLSVIADPDYGDITDPTTGRDIMIERQTPAEAGNQYGKTTVRVKPNQTPITDDKSVLESVLTNQSDLTELYSEPTYDELKEVLQNYLNPSDDSETTTETTATPEKVAEKTETKSTADVSDAFDELFNN